MKKILIMLLSFGIQSVGIASESEGEDESNSLSHTHKCEVLQGTKETIYYPKEYGSYQEFEEKNLPIHITKLLKDRLLLLLSFKNLMQTPKFETTRSFYEDKVSRNSRALEEVCKGKSMPSNLFDETWLQNSFFLENQMLGIANHLKIRLQKGEWPKQYHEKLPYYIAEMDKIIQEVNLSRGEKDAAAQEIDAIKQVIENDEEDDNTSSSKGKKRKRQNKKSLFPITAHG